MSRRNKYRLAGLLITWLTLRRPTLEGDTYTIENPLSLLLKNSGVVRLSNGYRIQYDKENKQEIINLVILALQNGIRFGEKEGQWKLDPANGIMETHQGIRLYLERTELLDETFLYQIHFSGFDLRDRVVVTAGAYIGDTPLFYAKYGARVYGFEPDPAVYHMALRNIDLNPELSGRIKIANYALGKDEEILFHINPGGSEVSSIYSIKNNDTVKVKSKSISSILKDFDISDPYLLDLDIKGSEYDVIEDPSIQQFHRVRIEYSPYIINSQTKSLEYLISKLKGYGFTQFRVYKHNAVRADLNNHGTLEAEK